MRRSALIGWAKRINVPAAARVVKYLKDGGFI